MRRVVILERAAEDIERAREFYDAQEPGTGDYFTASLIEDLERLALYHGIHFSQFGFYRLLSEKFPFGIYYREKEIETQIAAILDLRKDPNWIRKELSDRNR